ncbi:SMAD/FHA domain-containing protein [Armillaria novae-zelandiae]|uniref:SMAD/FHA domain-containing protein n=1 Tax=Armillaria novae-zelandiae TaxID=153914 RepID=A0AA39TZK6_9AGAR|nr:SMAD/FHA domain-containing protein [Armillaria novae-zelandiae]
MDPNAVAGSESPPLRSTILSSFLRGRPRNTSQSQTEVARELSPSPTGQPPSPVAAEGSHRRWPAAAIMPPTGGVVQPSVSATSTTSTGGLGLSHMLRRRRSGGVISAQTSPVVPALPSPAALAQATTPSTAPASRPTTGPSHRLRLVPHLDSRRSLRFDAISRDVKEGDTPLRIGRFTDRSGIGLAAVNALHNNKVAFKSKVVSRAHAEIWVDSNARFFVKDTKSSSGTFLNHVRLSPANTESRPHQIKDGDILQLGVDYQGGAEDIYKSVKIRIELGREWQAAANAFNTNALKNLKSLSATVAPAKPAAGTKTATKSTIPDCCICLFNVTIRQALFIAPCSHTFHYKCIRPLLESHHPAFSCPLCRTFADLEEDVEVDAEAEDDENDDSSAVDDSIRKREKEAADACGAETEVEGDIVGSRARRRSRGPSMDLMDEEEEEEAGEEMMIDGDLRSGEMDIDHEHDHEALHVESEGSGEGGSAGEGMHVDVDTPDTGDDGEGPAAKRKR